MELKFILLQLCGFICLVQAEFRPTVIRMKANITGTDEEMFVRGGFGPDHLTCTNENDLANPCAIPIHHVTHKNVSRRYDAYSVNDNFLDFYGPEKDQGSFEGHKALGTPMYWHSNRTKNHSKDHPKDHKQVGMKGYWVAEFEMDCRFAHGPQMLFEFKPIRRLHHTQMVQFDPIPSAPIVDTTNKAEYIPPWDGGNYWGQCGRINTVELGDEETQLS